MPDARQVAIELAKSHRLRLSILMLTRLSMAATGKKCQSILNESYGSTFQPRNTRTTRKLFPLRLERGEGRGGHGARTWVTDEGIDMGNRIGKHMGFFRGHALEIYFSDSSAGSLCETAVEGPTTPGASVPNFWDQSKNRLQVEATFWGARRSRNVRSVASSPEVAWTDAETLAQSYPAIAAAPSALGCKENSATPARTISPAALAGSANHYVVAGTVAVGAPAAPTLSARSTVAAPALDGPQAFQSGMVRRFQRLVPNQQWAADRAFDGTRYVQSVYFERSAVARPAVVACARSLYAVVRAFWFAPGYSSGQWRSLWIQRPSGSDPIECLVDGVGYPSGVYCAGASRTERGARANAPGIQSRSGHSCFQHDARSTTANRPLGGLLQWNPAARSFGPANPGSVLSSWPTAPIGQPMGLEISQALGGTQRAQQRADSVAGKTSLCGRSVRRNESRIETCGGRQAHRVFGTRATGRVARVGCWRPPACGLCPQASNQTSESVTYVLASLCYPCPCPVP